MGVGMHWQDVPVIQGRRHYGGPVVPCLPQLFVLSGLQRDGYRPAAGRTCLRRLRVSSVGGAQARVVELLPCDCRDSVPVGELRSKRFSSSHTSSGLKDERETCQGPSPRLRLLSLAGKGEPMEKAFHGFVWRGA